jgi:hypothetical protein
MKVTFWLLSPIQDLLEFSCVRPIKTVYLKLERYGALDLLRDELVSVATKEIYSAGRTRRDVQKDIKSKERAIETLASRYAREGLPQEDIRQCLYSIGDNHAFLRTNRDPCDRMIAYLKVSHSFIRCMWVLMAIQEYFHPTNPGKEENTSLAIRSGRGGARLSHDHSKQYAYVLQSLTLWREILHGETLNNPVLTLLNPSCQICFIYGHSPSRTSCPRPFDIA